MCVENLPNELPDKFPERKLLRSKFRYLFSSYPPKTVKSESEVVQSCPTLCNPVDCSPPGSSVHGTLQTRILEWVAISFLRGSSLPRDWTQVSRIAGRHFNLWATREAQEGYVNIPFHKCCLKVSLSLHPFWVLSIMFIFANLMSKPDVLVKSDNIIVQERPYLRRWDDYPSWRGNEAF